MTSKLLDVSEWGEIKRKSDLETDLYLSIIELIHRYEDNTSPSRKIEQIYQLQYK